VHLVASFEGVVHGNLRLLSAYLRVALMYYSTNVYFLLSLHHYYGR
jgi:hypothetical protein